MDFNELALGKSGGDFDDEGNFNIGSTHGIAAGGSGNRSQVTDGDSSGRKGEDGKQKNDKIEKP